MSTLLTALERATALPSAATSFHGADGARTETAAEVLERARGAATVLAERGVGRGDRVGILGPNRSEWLTFAFAAWMLDATVVPLPFHLLATTEVVGRHVGSILRSAPCRVVVTNAEFAAGLPRRQSWVDWGTTSGATIDTWPQETDTPAVIQFTSGSTSSPKGVVLPHATMLRAIQASFASSGLSHDDVKVSWMPLFHDWGFVSYGIGPITWGVRTHIMEVERFATDPTRWLRLTTEVGGTVMSAPPSAWAIALRSGLERPEGIDLGRVWHADVAAEMIAPEIVDALQREGPRLGLRPDALTVSYGMAEMGLGATRTDPRLPVPVATIDPEALEQGVAQAPSEGAAGKRVIGCGTPIGETVVSIRVGGQAVEDLRVGEVHLRMPDMFSGYLQDGAVTSALTDDGFLPTGDLGFLDDGILYVTGRTKEVVMVGGRNVPAQDIEWAAERATGIRRGRTLAFSLPDTEGAAVVVVEPGRLAEPSELARSVRAEVRASLGLQPEVLVVARGTVTKTTSGKLRRVPAKEAYLRGELPSLARLT